jgi:hypothetical protein
MFGLVLAVLLYGYSVQPYVIHQRRHKFLSENVPSFVSSSLLDTSYLHTRGGPSDKDHESHMSNYIDKLFLNDLHSPTLRPLTATVIENRVVRPCLACTDSNRDLLRETSVSNTNKQKDSDRWITVSVSSAGVRHRDRRLQNPAEGRPLYAAQFDVRQMLHDNLYFPRSSVLLKRHHTYWTHREPRECEEGRVEEDDGAVVVGSQTSRRDIYEAQFSEFSDRDILNKTEVQFEEHRTDRPGDFVDDEPSVVTDDKDINVQVHMRSSLISARPVLSTPPVPAMSMVKLIFENESDAEYVFADEVDGEPVSGLPVANEVEVPVLGKADTLYLPTGILGTIVALSESSVNTSFFGDRRSVVSTSYESGMISFSNYSKPNTRTENVSKEHTLLECGQESTSSSAGADEGIYRTIEASSYADLDTASRNPAHVHPQITTDDSDTPRNDWGTAYSALFLAGYVFAQLLSYFITIASQKIQLMRLKCVDRIEAHAIDLLTQERFTQAAQYLECQLPFVVRTHGVETAKGCIHTDIAGLRHLLAKAVSKIHQYDYAEALLHTVLTIYSQDCSRDGNVMEDEITARVYDDLAHVQTCLGKDIDSEHSCKQARRIRAEVVMRHEYLEQHGRGNVKDSYENFYRAKINEQALQQAYTEAVAASYYASDATISRINASLEEYVQTEYGALLNGEDDTLTELIDKRAADFKSELVADHGEAVDLEFVESACSQIDDILVAVDRHIAGRARMLSAVEATSGTSTTDKVKCAEETEFSEASAEGTGAISEAAVQDKQVYADGPNFSMVEPQLDFDHEEALYEEIKSVDQEDVPVNNSSAVKATPLTNRSRRNYSFGATRFTPRQMSARADTIPRSSNPTVHTQPNPYTPGNANRPANARLTSRQHANLQSLELGASVLIPNSISNVGLLTSSTTFYDDENFDAEEVSPDTVAILDSPEYCVVNDALNLLISMDHA